MDPYAQRSHQFIVSNNVDVIKMVDGPPTQEESGSIAHVVKCTLCKKNNWHCVGIPGWTCNECTKAKVKCNKSLGQIRRREGTKAVDTKGKAPGESQHHVWCPQLTRLQFAQQVQ